MDLIDYSLIGHYSEDPSFFYADVKEHIKEFIHNSDLDEGKVEVDEINVLSLRRAFVSTQDHIVDRLGLELVEASLSLHIVEGVVWGRLDIKDDTGAEFGCQLQLSKDVG